MMTNRYRPLVLAGVAGTAAVAWLNLGAAAQQPQPAAPPAPVLVPAQVQRRVPAMDPPGTDPAKNAITDSVTLPTDRSARRRIEVAEDFIKQELWGEAARVLQTLLDTKEDLFVEVTRNGNTHWVSLRREANRLLGGMPPQGRQFYELQFGARAKARLAEARAQSDPKVLAEVAQRFMYTEAGAQANDLLGSYHLDRGNALQAALCFDRVLGQEKPESLPHMTLVKAALAFRRAGESARADEIWKVLARVAGRQGVPVGGRAVPLEALEKEVTAYAGAAAPASPYDWALYKGNASRCAQGNGGAPFLEDKWPGGYPTFEDANTTGQLLQKEIEDRLDKKEPVLPAFFPVAVTVRTDTGSKPLLVYRTHSGICARDLSRGGKLEWKSPCKGSLDSLLKNPGQVVPPQQQWLDLYKSSGSLNLVYENSTVGTLSTDNKYVYIVDDLVLPPHPQSQMMQQHLMWGQAPTFGARQDLVLQSQLMAYELRTGKLIWELGGTSADKEETTDKAKLSGCYFLGPPLPVGDKLYVLVDKNSELRLVCLDCTRDPVHPAVCWIQTLANLRDKMLQDVRRRVQAAHLSYGQGILVCPTNAGVVLGIDLLAQSFAWAYAYREDSPAQAGDAKAAWMGGRVVMPNGQVVPAGLNTDGWKTSAPVIQDGRVVFTAPDASSVHCLDLRTGELRWKQPRQANDDLYLAGVYGGKVLLVGRRACRALSLADGRQLWRRDTGTPSGQGVASENVYYLPLRAAAGSSPEARLPQVCALDIGTGEILGAAVARPDPAAGAGKGDDAPGNLLFYEGDVISQTATRVAAYRQLRVKLQDIDAALQRDPRDPSGLFQRGEIKFEKGDWAGAAEDLRTALANDPPAEVRGRARQKLFETYTRLIQRDFNAGEKYLSEYEAMCEVEVPAEAPPEERQKLEDERQRRRGNFLCLLAKGREHQGRLAEAFQAYLDFAAEAARRELVSVLDEPTVKARPDVWAQGRIAAMVAQATPEQRRPLEELVARQWQTVRDANDVEGLRRFVAVFGSLLTVGKEARLKLAERLAEEDAFLEAELNLLRLRRQEEPAAAARAAEALARLMLRQGLFEDAAHWYQVLARDFASVTVRDGKRGTDYLDVLATDKRLLPYLDGPRQPWANARMKAKEVAGNFGPQPTFALEPDGEVAPFFGSHRLVIQNPNTLKLVDRSTAEVRYSEHLGGNDNLPFLYGQGQPGARLLYHAQGHLVVFNVGATVYAFDPVARRKLWERSLHGSASPAQQAQLIPDQNGNLQVTYPDGHYQRLGQAVPVDASCVCLLTRDGLTALDPLKGSVLWTRTDVSLRTQVFADAQHVYLVETGPDGAPAAGRALRARDGVAVEVPDFAPAYAHRLRVMGRRLLVGEDDPRKGLALRLYDIPTGKDVWKKSFPAGAMLLQTEEPDLVGVAEPKSGKVTVFDVATQKEVLAATVKPDGRVAVWDASAQKEVVLEPPLGAEHLDKVRLDKVRQVHLLADRDHFYLAFNRPPEALQGVAPGVVNGGLVGPNVMSGLRCLPVNGEILALPRGAGQFWFADVPSQMFVLDQYKDLPVLLFTANQSRVVGGGNWTQTAATLSLEKATGRRVYDNKDKGLPNRPNHHFLALVANAQAGTIELVGHQLKIVHYLEGSPEPRAGAAPASDATRGVPAAVPLRRVPPMPVDR
jgi:outer membrane protein assembly factor BamB